jgi:hypothetical protein
MRLRKRRRHAAKHPPIIENPQTSAMLRRRAASPWAVIGLYVFSIIILVLIMMLFGYQSKFSDYLNQRGEYADRQRTEQKQFICELIAELHDGSSGQLRDLAHRLHCANGPLPPLSSADSSASPAPIAPGTPYFTSPPGDPATGPEASRTGPATGGNRPLGTKVPAGSAAPSGGSSPQAGTGRSGAPPPTPDRPAPTTSPPSPAPGGGGGVRFCVPLTDLCVG